MIDFIGNNVRPFTKCYSAVSPLSFHTILKGERGSLDGRSPQKNNSIICTKCVILVWASGERKSYM